MPETTANMLVYRDGSRRVSAKELVRQLVHTLESLGPDCAQDDLLNALLCSGELECALCDANSADSACAACITDKIASLVCCAERDEVSLQNCRQLLNSVRIGGELSVSRPEGFAYYALHPLDFADTVSRARLRGSHAYVIGIRSIGTTLSAVVAAKLNADGIAASRTTVRPEGHPYDRRTGFTGAQRAALRQALSRDAVFIVCDEGPGRSGSSLLSVAEALEREGVDCDRIVLLCSHQPAPNSLCAPDADRRWGRYRSLASGTTTRLPKQADSYLSADGWRALFIPHQQPWPAAWPQMERLKFLSRDRKNLLKFEGHGPYGEAVRRREQLLTASGFGARYAGNEAGFGIHELIAGKRATTGKPSRALLSHVARYCAWRATELPATVSPDAIRQLEHMAAHNLEQEFGFAPGVRLGLERPVICDGRMQPHKWLEAGDGHYLKLDASTHGDDHFYPGPVDIAWDLAGVCVEWQLDPEGRGLILSEYRRLSGDDAAARLAGYEFAYAAFRLGWSRMAAASMSGAGDESRLLADAARYRLVLDRMLLSGSLSR